MSNQEFSDKFDVLVNAFNVEQGFGKQDYLSFDEYEKSVFLTQALGELVISFYDGKNQYGNLFERTEEDRRFLNALVKTSTIDEEYQINPSPSLNTPYSHLFRLPSDTLFVTYEQVIFNSTDASVNGKTALVVPVAQDDYYKTVENPFRGPNKKRVLRLDIKGNVVELISKYPIGSYQVRYVAKPNPIILVDLPGDLEIWGKNIESMCDLNDATHEWILTRAVQLAIGSRNVGANK